MRTIALEEHFATSAFLDGPSRSLKDRAEQAGGRFAALIAQLLDVGEGRVAAMDAAGVTMQALSLTAPGVEQLDVEEAKTFARSTNAALGEAVRRHPTRFFGLAALPIADPPAAVAELERVVGEHGSKASSSMAIIAGDILTTVSSGRSWRGRSGSGFRSISIRRHRLSR
jgi:uncharacterized protein